MKKTLTAVLGSLFCAAAPAQIIINEIMQSNIDCIMDDLNEFPDSWVELYNTTDNDINLKGYGLCLTNNFAAAYKLPQIIINAHNYALIYCDKVGEKRHTDFRIDSGKGSLYLFDAGGALIDKLEDIKKQPAPNVAYGRETDGADKWGYELTPTPSKSNSGGLSKTILKPVKFGTQGGVWNATQKISLELAAADDSPAGTYIRYTTDGSEPTATNGKRYESPIQINTGMAVRAKAFCEGCVSIPSNAQSYIFLGRAPKIPVMALAIDSRYLYDTKIGILVEGTGGKDHENFRNDWRRPTNIEFFETEGAPATLNQLCETRVQGGYTRINALKSMAVYANKRFGEKRLKCEFWDRDKPGVTDNKSIILRSGGNDFMGTYVRDGLIQRIMGRNAGTLDWQGYKPVIVCINGKYHGYLGLRERSNEDNVSANYKGLEDIDMIEGWEELKAGDMVEFNKFLAMLNESHTLEEWKKVIDVESFLDLMIVNYWVYNTDFPHKNIVMWRNRTPNADGRWRWLMKDCDFGLGIYGWHPNADPNFTDYLSDDNAHTEGKNSPAYKFWKRIKNDKEFMDLFADRLIARCGDFLNGQTFTAYLNEILDESQGEIKFSHNKWRGDSWWSDFDNNISGLKQWINKRQNNIATLIKNSFALGSPVKVYVNANMAADKAAQLKITYDGVPLATGRFSGTDYVRRTIRLNADAESGIVAWDLTINDGAPTRYQDPALSYDITGANTLRFTPVFADENAIEDVRQADAYTVEGNTITGRTCVSVYDAQGRLVRRGRQVEVPGKGLYIVVCNGVARKVLFAK